MPDIFLSYNREDQATARRRLNAADRSITLEEIEAANVLSSIGPETSADLNATFRKVWLAMPPESLEP